MSKQTYTVTGELLWMERLPSSANGNPRYKFAVGTPGDSVVLRTGPDSALAYVLPNYFMSKDDGPIVTVSYRNLRGYDTAEHIKVEG